MTLSGCWFVQFTNWSSFITQTSILLRSPPVAVKWASKLTALGPAGTTNLYCFAPWAGTVNAGSPIGRLMFWGASCATAIVQNSMTALRMVFIGKFIRQSSLSWLLLVRTVLTVSLLEKSTEVTMERNGNHWQTDNSGQRENDRRGLRQSP